MSRAHEEEASPHTWRQVALASPEVIFDATDDRGTSYGCWSSGGYGGGAGPREMLWRRDYVFAPPIDADARTLRLAVPAIEWVRYEPGQGMPTIEKTQPMGWALTVPVA